MLVDFKSPCTKIKYFSQRPFHGRLDWTGRTSPSGTALALLQRRWRRRPGGAPAAPPTPTGGRTGRRCAPRWCAGLRRRLRQKSTACCWSFYPKKYSAESVAKPHIVYHFVLFFTLVLWFALVHLLQQQRCTLIFLHFSPLFFLLYTVQLFSPPFLHHSHFPIYFSFFPLSPFLIRLFSPGVLREKEGGRRWFPQFFSLSRASHDSSSFLLLLSLGPKAVSRILCARNGKEMVLNFRRSF